MDTNFDVIVVGAGAAGLIAAARAAERDKNVLLLEKMERPGRKLLITGKGRCNITNAAYTSEFIKQVYPNGKFLRNAFGRYFSKDILEQLAKYGVETNTERGGRIFPADNNAASVVKALVKWTSKANITTKYHQSVTAITASDKKITGLKVSSNEGEITYTAPKVIIATGGKSYPATGSTGDGYVLAKAAGHSITETRPSLVPLITKGHRAKDLQGLALKNANVILWINGKKKREEFGELLFTHFGLSGPVILTLSRDVVDAINQSENVEISIDLKPALDEQKLDARLLRDLSENGKKNLDNIFKSWLPSKMIPLFFKETEIDPKKEGHQLSAKERKKVKSLMKDFRLSVTGHRSYKEAIITAGGVKTNEINPKTMESKLMEGLFFAGEVLDLDAKTGGYNLQIAWSTGWVAGDSC